MSEMLIAQGIVPGIKVDKGLAPLPNSNGYVGVFNYTDH
jgi:fructose-bisphosphate aldolase class 1